MYLRRISLSATAVAALLLLFAHETMPTAAAQAGTGTIKGQIKLTGPIPANPIIRMGMNPLCSKANGGKRLTKQIVVAAADGSLGNVVVQLAGNLPAGTPPAEPVVIERVTIEETAPA